MKYYIIRNRQPFGPLEKHELQAYGLTRDSDVWHEGLPQWVKAGTVPALADLFEESAFGAYTQPGQAAPYSPPPSYNLPEPIPHTNWLPWAIVAAVLGFVFSCIGMIFGIVGIVQANKANRYYAEGVRVAGDSANTTAKTMTIIGYVIAALGLAWTIWLLSQGNMSAFIEAMERLN